MSDSSEDRSTTDAPRGLLEGLSFWIIVASTAAVLLLIVIAVTLIILCLTRRRKHRERRDSDVMRDRVERAFNTSLKLKGNELLREDYERYVKSDVYPLKDRTDEERRKSLTAAYDEVPYSPDDVKKPDAGVGPPQSDTTAADDKRRRFADSHVSDADSGHESSPTSYGKEQTRHPLSNGRGYKHLRQSSSVDISETTEPQPRDGDSSPGDSGKDMNEFGSLGRSAHSVAISSDGEREHEDDVGSQGGSGDSDGYNKFARSNSSFDHTDEVGITPL